jgi:chromosome segregation ATPase
MLTILQRTVTQLRTLHELLVEAEIRSIEARSEFNALKKENQDILQKQQRKLAEIQDLAKRKETLRSEYHRLYETTQEGLSSLTQAEEKMVKEYRQLPSLEALELEVQAVAARLEMMAEGNPSLIKDYEQREENITIIRGKLEELTMSLESTKEKIMEIREQWEPQLDALVRKISDDFAHNFQQIGCAGEVTVHKDEEDFDKWSIQISVRFR